MTATTNNAIIFLQFLYKKRSCRHFQVNNTTGSSFRSNATHTLGTTTDSGITDCAGRGPQCTSTCSIVLTACTDLVPPPQVRPQGRDEAGFSSPLNDPLDLKDVAVQTSDCEVYYTKDLAELEARHKQMQELRKLVEESREYERQIASVIAFVS